MIDDDKNTEETETTDFESYEDDDDIENFDSFDSDDKSLGDIIREKPILKVIIAGIVIVLIILVFLFVRGKQEPTVSSVPPASDVSAAPGTDDVSQNVRNAFEESDQQRREVAEQTGGSALPTLIEPPVGTIAIPDDEQQEEDPLQRWRRLQQDRLRREAEQATVAQPGAVVQDQAQQENIQALADLMATQMQSILDRSQDDITITTVAITPDNYLEQFMPPDPEGFGDLPIENVPQEVRIIQPAGDIEYGQLLLEANSDVPGPVLARLASGPLRGSRVIGGFEVANKKLVLTFNTVIINGISVPMNGVAIDPGTSLPGLATEVDNRYFKRVILPAAAAFIEGAAEAVSKSGRTTVTIQGDQSIQATENQNQDEDEEIAAGVEEAAQEIGQILDQEAQATQVLVRIESGTPVGILFLEPVTDEDLQQ